jgi:hypothetical protein
MKVICISAKAQHGKDTAAQLLKEYLESINKRVLIIHYADLLKFICTKFFGWDGNKDEAGRTILQHVGTDTIRRQEPDYWVDFVVKFLKLFSNDWDYVLIPDCRFPNEAEKMMASFDTKVLRIYRPNFNNGLSAEQLAHPSETSMDHYKFDAIISNDGSLDELRQKLIGFISADSHLTN